MHRAISAVVQNNDRKREVFLGGTPKRLNRVHQRSISDDPNHFSIVSSESHAHSCGQSITKTTTCHGEEAASSSNREVLLQRRSMRRRLFYNYRVIRQKCPQLLQYVCSVQFSGWRQSLVLDVAGLFRKPMLLWW